MGSKRFPVNCWGCPCCTFEVEADEEDQYINDEDSETIRECPECGVKFRLKAVEVDVVFEAETVN